MKQRPVVPVTAPEFRERRHKVRTPIKVAATIVGGDGAKVFGWAANISMGGLYFEGSRQFPPETHVSLHLLFRADQMETRNLYLAGWVAHTAGKGMGIQLASLGVEKARLLAALIQKFADTGA